MFPNLLQVVGLAPGLWTVDMVGLSWLSKDAYYRELSEGDGPAIVPGMRITFEFTARLISGKELANTQLRGMPFTLIYDPKEPIWGVSLRLAKLGTMRRVLLNPQAAYGVEGVPGIVPPDQPLLLDISILNKP